MAYAVIELLPLNFALNPLFCKTDVSCCTFYLALFLFLVFTYSA